MQQILEPQDLKGPPHFWPCYPKSIGLTFSFLKFVSTCKKMASFHHFILEIQPICETHDQNDHIHFWQSTPKNFPINYLFLYIFVNIQNIRIFELFFSKIYLILKSCNLLGLEHFGPYIIFCKHGICTET